MKEPERYQITIVTERIKIQNENLTLQKAHIRILQ